MDVFGNERFEVFLEFWTPNRVFDWSKLYLGCLVMADLIEYWGQNSNF